jgi:hypothetical protein
MRRYPTLTELPTSRDFIENFGGYNHNVRIGENEFYDMKNLTSSHYPVLATRNKRGTYLRNDGPMGTGPFQNSTGEKVIGLIEKNGLCIITFGVRDRSINAYINGKYHYVGLTSCERNVKRAVVSMGAYIVIFPDNMYINTADPTDHGSLEGEWTKSNDSGGLFFLPYTKDGNLIKIYGSFNRETNPNYLIDYEDKDEMGGPVNGSYIMELSSGDLCYWSSSVNGWFTERAYLGICNPRGNFTSKFKEGDGVRIGGFSDNENDTRILNDLFKNDLGKPFTITSIADDVIVFNYTLANFINANEDGTIIEYSTNSNIALSKKIPLMDYVIESGNRLWGCRYGKNRYGETVNEIYVSKLSDFSNWETFSGISTDSYTVSVGTDGPFTGAVSYLGRPLFFKQNCIHMLYGDYTPYRLQTTECKGVQQGCADSLAIVGGTLFYKSVRGVCAYTGSMPTDIGYAFNEQELSYKDAFASEYKGKYYLSMVDENNERQLFVYDLGKGMWHKEGSFDGECFCLASKNGLDALYYLISEDYKVDSFDYAKSYVKLIEGYEGFTDDEKVDWMAETGVIGCYTHDKKYVSRISFRLSMDIGTRLYVFAEYDSSGTWEQIGAIAGTSLSTFTFPVRPKRCDHLRLKLVGTGATKIYSMSKTLEQGSEM